MTKQKKPQSRPQRHRSKSNQSSAPRQGAPNVKRPAVDKARGLAVAAISAVLHDGRSLDSAFDSLAASAPFANLEPRDRAFARLIVMTVLRRKGELQEVVSRFLQKPLPSKSGNIWPILLSAAAQLLILETPPHAAISVAVDQTRHDRRSAHFDKLANAVLRRVAEQGAEILASLNVPEQNMPVWLLKRWREAYGPDLAHKIALASLEPATLDISVKRDPSLWAEKLGANMLPTGSLRLQAAGRIEALEGFQEGAWWVQDAAAALPAKLLGNISGLRVADLCAAPGGKTAELAAAGANVTAVEISPARRQRIDENLTRLGLTASIVEADATTWQSDQQFDCVLLDAPCTATGTIRRHPDILHLKREQDIADLAKLQQKLLARAIELTKPGGKIVFCTCSLEPEEGVAQITRLLSSRPDVTREPIKDGEAGISADWITQDGDLRTSPIHGLDGFYAARLRRAAT